MCYEMHIGNITELQHPLQLSTSISQPKSQLEIVFANARAHLVPVLDGWGSALTELGMHYASGLTRYHQWQSSSGIGNTILPVTIYSLTRNLTLFVLPSTIPYLCG